MRFLLDNDVDAGVARVLRRAGHDVVAASEVGLAGVDAAANDELTVYASDHDRVLVTHDRAFTARRRRNTIGLHVRIAVEQPDGPEVSAARLDELLDTLAWTESAGLELSRAGVRHHPPTRS